MRKTIVMLGALGIVATAWLNAASPMKAASQGSRSDRSGPDVSKDVKDRFTGTWKLVKTERFGSNGQPTSTSPSARIGYLIYDPAGYMGVTIMQPDRPKYAGDQPTPEEAKAALSGYTSYFGTFTVDSAGATITHHLQGSSNPNMAADQKRGFEFSENRLVLKPPASANGEQSRLTWERVPDLPNLTAAHRRFIGFWKLVSNERRRPGGEVVSSNPGQTGFIIYTASGIMAVHLMQPGRKKYTAAQPTPDEAKSALTSYGSYFGPYTIHEPEHYVVHHRIGTINPGTVGSDAQRFYEFIGNRLILRPPPATIDGQPVQGTLTWERLGSPTSSAGL